MLLADCVDQLEPGGKAIPGYMTQLTVTGPFINCTLFEQAGVPVPSGSSDKVTWQEWADATKKVADAIGNGYCYYRDEIAGMT